MLINKMMCIILWMLFVRHIWWTRYKNELIGDLFGKLIDLQGRSNVALVLRYGAAFLLTFRDRVEVSSLQVVSPMNIFTTLSREIGHQSFSYAAPYPRNTET
jgi:hypothetical protein